MELSLFRTCHLLQPPRTDYLPPATHPSLGRLFATCQFATCSASQPGWIACHLLATLDGLLATCWSLWMDCFRGMVIGRSTGVELKIDLLDVKIKYFGCNFITYSHFFKLFGKKLTFSSQGLTSSIVMILNMDKTIATS